MVGHEHMTLQNILLLLILASVGVSQLNLTSQALGMHAYVHLYIE